MSWTFANPERLWWALLPLGVALWFLLRKRPPRSKEILPFSVSAPFLLKEAKRSRWIHRALFFLMASALGLLAIVAARPIQRRSWTEKSAQSIDIVITLDVSDSMDADDFRPTRLRVAKDVISDFIRRRESDRIGFNVFGGEAVTKSPLTTDHEFLLNQVENIQLRELKQGTAIGMGLANAIVRLKGSQSKTKLIVLLTDGDSNVGSINPITASVLARQEGIKIYTIGMGQKNRVIIPIYQYDDSGRRGALMARIPSYLNPALLKEIATNTGGKAYMARDSGMLNRILLEIDALEKTRVRMLPREKQEEKYFYPAALALLTLYLIILLMETRYYRGRRQSVVTL
jgi:Ca-activated chloride channel homolog